MLARTKNALLVLTASLAILAPWWLGAGLPSAAVAAQKEENTIPDKVKLFIPYKEYSQEDNQRILQLFEGLRVADVSDGMDVVGLQDIGIVNPEIRALWTDTENFTHRMVGIAVTARYVPTNKREPKMDRQTIGRWYSTVTSEAFQEMLFPGSMLVIDAMEDGESRSIGSSNIKSWQSRGMVGLVTSGGLADTDEIIHQKIPCYFRRLARGIRPGRNELESVNRPVTMWQWFLANVPKKLPRRPCRFSITSGASATSRGQGKIRAHHATGKLRWVEQPVASFGHESRRGGSGDFSHRLEPKKAS